LQRRTLAASAVGAVFGAVIALGVLAVAAARVIESGVELVAPDSGGRGSATFLVGEGAMDLLIVVAGLVAGALLGGLGYAVAKQAAPDSPRVAPAPLVLVGAVTGAVIGFAVARSALGLAAVREAELVSVTVFRAAMVALIAGAATGGVIGGTVERLSRPSAFAFGGEAWPASPVAFAREALRAVGLPALAILLGIGVVSGLAWLLLQASQTVGLIVFGGLAALVLFGAAFIAAHPPQRGDNG
jgi:hypothetical protein